MTTPDTRNGPDILGDFRIPDSRLRSPDRAPTMVVMSAATPHPGLPAGVVALRPLRPSDLETFWPSRRGHAFDELCR